MISGNRSPANHTVRSLACCLTVVLASGLAGCGSPIDRMTFFPVKGKVVLADGKPLAAGNVVFVATESTLTSAANLENDGTFVVKGSKEGLPAGEYLVRIEVDESETGPSKAKSSRRKGGPVPFPEKYLDEDASGLRVTVKPSPTENNFEFKLTK
jgi:hypothetical protein